MRPFRLLLQARPHALRIAAACAVALGAAFACTSQSTDFHDSDDVKGKPCISCHSAAFNAASNPVHVGQMPDTCQDCHSTKAWVPSSATNHPWWPLQNKHVEVACTTCHDKGFKVGDTPKDCVACHRKDYDCAGKGGRPACGQRLEDGGRSPEHLFVDIDGKSKDVYPLDCAMCHNDTGFVPSVDAMHGGQRFKHEWWALEGRHTITPCAGCHPGTPPTYKGVAKDCFGCHQKDFDTTAQQANPSHPTFPHTCLNCHLMSGWKQGPPLSGLHPEAKFPITTGAHADPRIQCQDCHRIEKGGLAITNTDCINCHMTGNKYSPLGSHATPEVDQYHAKTTVSAGYATQQARGTTNYCLASGCHSSGEHRP